MKQYIKVRNQFDGVHCWPECPHSRVAFLKNPHRHIFYVYTTVEVSHSRAIEFFMLQSDIDTALNQLYGADGGKIFQLGSRSCETIATELNKKLSEEFGYQGLVTCIEVSEDNENTAIVRFDKF